MAVQGLAPVLRANRERMQVHTNDHFVICKSFAGHILKLLRIPRGHVDARGHACARVLPLHLRAYRHKMDRLHAMLMSSTPLIVKKLFPSDLSYSISTLVVI